jgi:hypothetical protein
MSSNPRYQYSVFVYCEKHDKNYKPIEPQPLPPLSPPEVIEISDDSEVDLNV